MKINEKLHGFFVVSKEEIREAAGTLYHFEHEKTGARLAFLDREDTNKSFAIAFPTLPEDDTGVFHIIEHSVLCGSEKFPVKEPFVELLKGSLNTFLNAMTYEDRTVYPVASRCDKDFYNLTDVYLDAVFNPRMKSDRSVFRQEGWHLENSGGSYACNGVVYNEMKGAYSSPDELGFSALSNLLFEGTPYGKDSGGRPSAIPTLTYEGFLAAHDKYYHPSNAYVFLDGSVNLSEILPLIDSYFSRYDKKDIEVDFASSPVMGESFARVGFAPADENPRSTLYLGYVFSSFDKATELLATTLITDVLAGSNDAPLKKVILDSGLAEDVSVYTNRAKMQTIVVQIYGIDEKDADTLKALVEKTIRDLAAGGLSKERLESNLGRIEFKLREADHGSLPKGIANALAAFSSWVYGGTVKESLAYEDLIADLYSLIPTDYFEKTLLAATVDSPSRATVLLVPDREAEKKREEEEEKLVRNLVDSLSKKELDKLLAETEKMTEWQSSEDSPEALASLPSLSLSDVSDTPDRVTTQDYKVGSVRVLSHGIETAGILYTTLYFNASDLDAEELSALSLLSSVLQNLPTESYSPEELKNKIKANLGSFSVSTSSSALTDGSGRAVPFITLTASALSHKAELIPHIVSEVLLGSKFSATSEIRKIVLQLRSLTDEMIASSPDSIARGRAEAMVAVGGRISDCFGGMEFARFIRALAKELDGNISKIAERLCALAERVFTASRLTVSVSGDGRERLAENLAAIFPVGTPVPDYSNLEKLPTANEGLVTPAAISHTAKMFVSDKARELLGPLRVVRSILSYEYLWNNVRVKGGAYGTGFITRRNGLIGFYSYRDPSPAATLNCFSGASDYLRRLASDGADLTKFIIGAMGEYDILYTPRTRTAQAAADVITGWSFEKECAVKRAMIDTGADELRLVADLIDENLRSAATAVAASKETVESLDGKFVQIGL